MFPRIQCFHTRQHLGNVGKHDKESEVICGGWKIKGRMSRESNRLLQRERTAERTSGASIKQQHVWWPGLWYTTLWPSFSPSTLFFPFKPLLPLFLAFFDSLCLMQRPTCPEGTDLQDGFDPVVMILSFASATSSTCFELGQREEKRGEQRRKEESRGEENRGEENRGEESRGEERRKMERVMLSQRGHLTHLCRGEASRKPKIQLKFLLISFEFYCSLKATVGFKL